MTTEQLEVRSGITKYFEYTGTGTSGDPYRSALPAEAATATNQATTNTAIGATNSTAAADPSVTTGLSGLLRGLWTTLISIGTRQGTNGATADAAGSQAAQLRAIYNAVSSLTFNPIASSHTSQTVGSSVYTYTPPPNTAKVLISCDLADIKVTFGGSTPSATNGHTIKFGVGPQLFTVESNTSIKAIRAGSTDATIQITPGT